VDQRFSGLKTLVIEFFQNIQILLFIKFGNYQYSDKVNLPLKNSIDFLFNQSVVKNNL